MPEESTLHTTQRAYSLRLRGANETDDSWRDALWATHEVMNRGAKSFGNFLLTIRGGLDCRLADGGAPHERRNRRILLAVSWLVVEDRPGAPPEFIETDLVASLRTTLRLRGVAADEIEEWVADCKATLTATIRDDAVWVNRSAAFDKLQAALPGLDREFAERHTFDLFGSESAYLSLPMADAESTAVAAEAGDFRAKARSWVVQHFGTGAKSDKSKVAASLQTLASADLGNSRDEVGTNCWAECVSCLGLPTPKLRRKASGSQSDGRQAAHRKAESRSGRFPTQLRPTKSRECKISSFWKPAKS